MERCLFIHGFTGGIFEIEPLSEYLEQHHCLTRTFTLEGHTGRRADMLRANREDWYRQAGKELEELAENRYGVHVIGFSMGALIASFLAARHKAVVKSLTLLAAPVFPLNPAEIIKTLGSLTMLKNYVSKFGSTPVHANREFGRIVRESFDLYPQIEAPTLIVQGKKDHLVKTKSAAYLQQHIGSPVKEVLLIERSGHMLCYCEEKDKVMGEVLQFICGAS
ncbi:Esterase/lipase [Paenibacillus sophorae]|uniref:Alpha/beta fold hydrolase n=1 Tax=Paenibacillus sophorae TaxID=1333845 RepID=A0A1H8UU32_9BACL|nr:alpha/beta fold hydrolase [Paenibacillus sophorae]QWU15376.1 alpha/beta fold hydrolase [Paenibacillus sophorae]SEP06434.1 Esterase/lipase [Paenibacillus sophorae]